MLRSHSIMAQLVSPASQLRTSERPTNYVSVRATKRNFLSLLTLTDEEPEIRKKRSRPANSGRKFIRASGTLTLSYPVSFIQYSADTTKQRKRAVRQLNSLPTLTLGISCMATTSFTWAA